MAPRAAVYCRISRDAEGEGLGVQRQQEDCEQLISKNNWTLTKVYVDNDLSASSNAKKPRPQFEAMMTAAEAGELDVIVAYSNSRFTRRLSELERLIQTHEKTGVLFATVASGNDDLSLADGRMVARIKASVDAAEAERTSERRKRQLLDQAARGVPQGGRYRNYGYTRQFEIIEAEAEIVREVFTRKAAGQSATSIAKDLTSRGLTTVTGNPWNQSGLLKLLVKPGYAGLHSFKGQIIGRTNYPPIIDEALWRAANSEAAKMSKGTNARRWIFSGIAVCGVCGAGLTGNASINAYRCSPGMGGCTKIRMKVDFVEGPVISLMLDRIDHAGRPAAASTEAFDFTELDRKIVEVRQAWKSGQLDIADYVAATSELRAERREAEQAAASETVSTVGGPIVGITEWIQADVSQRRALIAREIRVVVVGTRRGKGYGTFDPGRLTITWADGSTTVPTHEDLAKIPYWHSTEGKWSMPKGFSIATLSVRDKH